MPAYEAYGQTDLYNDRNRLMNLLRTGRGRDRRTAQSALENLDRREQMQFQRQTQAENLLAHHQNLQETIASREQLGREAQAQREARAQEIQQAREDALA